MHTYLLMSKAFVCLFFTSHRTENIIIKTVALSITITEIPTIKPVEVSKFCKEINL